MVNNEGMFMIEELERIALERCKTAREAIKLIGELVKQYGYGDFGECITIADGKEVWHFEIMGAGPLEKGAVWAAVRIPDDHVGISANIPRIAEIDLKNPDRYMASENVFQVAQDMGWWDPKSGKPFKFWEAYSGRKPFSTREFFVLSTLAPSLKLTMDMPELPFSVKPEKKLSVRDVLAIYRNPYEGTELDIDQEPAGARGPSPGPSRARPRRRQPGRAPDGHEPDRQRLDVLATSSTSSTPSSRARSRPPRTIPISGCAYATVLQVRGWLPPGRRGRLLVRLRQPGHERPHPHLRRDDRAAAELRDLRPAPVPAGFRGLGLPPGQPAGHAEVGQTRKTIEAAIAEFEDKAFADLPAAREEGPGDPGQQDAGQGALHGRAVPDQVHQRHGPGRRSRSTWSSATSSGCSSP
ncbi:MAG: C69 family dipeptidase [Candidatus Moduliflexus flocculans]|nr:C69 family dipeptidase [Candidatus Moduliflexus flocculans]